MYTNSACNKFSDDKVCNPFSDTSYPSNKIGNGDGNNAEMTFPLHLIFTSVKGLPQVDYMYNKKHKIYYKCNTNWIVLLLGLPHHTPYRSFLTGSRIR